MASAIDIMNAGEVITFQLPNTTQDPTLCNNGIYFTDSFTAELGLEIKSGQRLSFQIDNIYMKNFTISEDGISGDAIQIPDSDAMGYQSQYYIDSSDCSASFVLDNDFAIQNNHVIKVAAYCTYDYGWQGTTNIVNLEYRFYDETADTFTTNPLNTGGQPIMSEHFATIPVIKAENCLYGNETTSEPAFNTFRVGVGYTFGTAGYARNIKNAGFVLATSYASNIPCFDTQAHAEAYLRDNTITEGLLNKGEGTDPEEEYEEQNDFWYIKNVWGHNTKTLTGYDHFRNYRFFPFNEQKIALLKRKPTAANPASFTLVTQFAYNVKTAGAFNFDDDDYVDAVTYETDYIKKSLSFGTDDYYTVFKWDTNIPTADSMEDIEDYFAGRKTIDQIATNWKDIARQVNELIAPDLPGLDLDESTPTGSNGMVYTYGAKLYEISNIELAALFSEMFTPQNLQSILDGNKLFGDDVFNAISNIIYLPLSDLSEICTFLSGTNNIWIGSWESQNAQGRLISANDKVIDCGSFFFTDNYGDFRSYDPYQRFYCMIPFCGFFELVVSKYIGKTVSCKMAIDITTGGVLAMLFADGIMLDQFSGQCGASRPVTARDSATYFSNIVRAITGAGGTFGNAAKGAGQAAAQIAGASSGAALAGGAAMGVGVAAVGAVGGTLKAYQIKEAIDSPPTMNSGALAGCMGYFSNTKVHFIVAQKKTVRPMNELEIIGYPSNMGGTVGSFSGFLQCSAFKLANGFTGTEKEREDILAIVKNGIYIE